MIIYPLRVQPDGISRELQTRTQSLDGQNKIHASCKKKSGGRIAIELSKVIKIINKLQYIVLLGKKNCAVICYSDDVKSLAHPN